ncbi:MAG: phosphoribosylformylglycinamidine cyclo-ligase [Ignavibacteria bacterium]|jgi:phosphoribosylformylglycinamidine cyclo-ligase
MKSTYTASGVNISEGDKFVETIKPLVKSTFSKNVISGIGNFGAFFKIPKNYKDPVFVASTDGVGTKIKIAIEMDKHDTVGEDIVNHCVNDIAVCGAVPLFFLDYLGFGKLRANIAAVLVKGMIKGCKNNGCSLIGGETAEMPGVYQLNDYDIAGMIVGAAEKKQLIDKKNVKAGDVLIGIPSTGLHTNGYSLARKVLLDKYKLDQKIDELDCTLGEELLKVHRSYLRIIQVLIKKFKIHSFSHITGGGIAGNTKRVIPSGMKLKIDWKSWERNPIFDLIKNTGNVEENEMRRVFNLGIGLVIIAGKNDTDNILSLLKIKKEKYYIIGEVTKE